MRQALSKYDIKKAAILTVALALFQLSSVAVASGLVIPIRPKAAVSSCPSGISDAECGLLKKGLCPKGMTVEDCKKNQETMKK